MIPSRPLDPTTLYLADKAATHYADHANEIDKITQRITENRSGIRSLTDITDDKSRLIKRAAREGGQFEQALERINGIPDFQDIATLRKIVRASASVCRIILQGPTGITGYGTGCLIAPNVLITNNHVFPDPDTASRAIAQFNYELGDNGQVLSPVSFRLRPDLFFLTSPYTEQANIPFSGRDFTLVAVESTSTEGGSLNPFGFIRLDPSLGKIIEGENCVVIQHPKGDYKKIVLKDIRLITFTDNFLIYEADTQPGSSGSLVLGLGTADAVALHHSAVPNKDANGNWLRKDGRPRQPGDTDDDVDWIGNEGVRVSCIVEAFNKLAIPDHMLPYRAKIVEAQTPPLLVNSPSMLTMPPPTIVSGNAPRAEVIPTTPAVSAASAPPAKSSELLYFEVLLTDQTTLQNDWTKRASELVPGFIDQTTLFPVSQETVARRMVYVTVKSSENPWALAATIEGLPHVEACRPDLQSLTDIGRNSTEAGASVRATESEFVINNGTEEPNEKRFLETWGKSIQVQAALNNGADRQRWWHWSAINWTDLDKGGMGLNKDELNQLRERLVRMRLIQLDTGYSDHSKVANGYNTDLDFDFIDNDNDARDELASFGVKFPYHGTRTASLVVGGSLADTTSKLDGNNGLLVEQGKCLTRLIPYRIAQSVILIGRGKQVVDGVNYAIRSGADVLFMCMGSYPRLMLEAIAREAYEKGVIWVCAAGNEVGLVVAPALYPGTIAVAATNPEDKPWSGSSHGPCVDIAAPGEDVYVPFLDKKGQEIMVYGSGTSYATPQVASAAMLWKARHYEQLSDYLPWQVVEAFRHTLKASARQPKEWPEAYGKGIIDITELLNTKLPEKDSLKHAYAEQKDVGPHSVGIAEAVHFIWNIFSKNVLPGATESTIGSVPLTQRGQQALAAFSSSSASGGRESSAPITDSDALLRYYFNQ
ncbi:S8 family serine peptidase [Spirosoma pulveris]